MPYKKRDNRKILTSLDASLTEDLLTEAYSAGEISEALRALGADPDATGRRGLAIVSEWLERRGLRAKKESDETRVSSTHAPIGWSYEIGSFRGGQERLKSLVNREFEFTQLHRAYRSGIIGSSTFESAVSDLETGSSQGRAGFQVFGKTYSSEREAVVNFLETVAAAEAAGADAIRGWLRTCRLESIKGGLKMIAERESYHAHAFAHRLAELGGSRPQTLSEEMRKNIAFLSDPDISDLEKLQQGEMRFPNPDETIRPLFEFADSLEEDLQTKEMVKLFAQDELSSLKWQNGLCAELTDTQSYGPLGVRG